MRSYFTVKIGYNETTALTNKFKTTFVVPNDKFAAVCDKDFDKFVLNWWFDFRPKPISSTAPQKYGSLQKWPKYNHLGYFANDTHSR